MDDDIYGQFIHLSRYARWLEDEKRRETWEETTHRYVRFFADRFPELEKEILALQQYIVDKKVMPSMRALMAAGPALDKDPTSNYNCAFTAIDHPKVFDEILYILCCGTGVGFSVERQYIAKLPDVAEEFYETDTTIVVPDSKIGWATAFRELLSLLWSGKVPKWDLSRIRPAGARLKTFGGRASGPDPLEDLFKFSVALFKKASGRKLSSIECHDLVCKIAEIVVVGAVRRSALLSLSNVSDDRMRDAKSGQWWVDNPQRALANNSACYTERPELSVFLKEWNSLYSSKSGERGIFSRTAANMLAKRSGRRETEGQELGTNPCSLTSDMRLLTSEGYKTFGELVGTEFYVVNHNGKTTKSTVWSNGEKPVISLRFWNKSPIRCTSDHRFMTIEGDDVEAQYLKGRRLMPFYRPKVEYSKEEVFAGFIQGNGCTFSVNNTSSNGLYVQFGEKDGDVASLYSQSYPKRWYSRDAMRIARAWGLSSEKLPNRVLPDKITPDFLTGLYSANGSVIKKHRVALKTTCQELAHQLVSHLEDMFGIKAYITTNKPKAVKFSNGTYTCKESYDVSISRFESVVAFAENISFVQEYKRKDLDDLIKLKSPKVMGIKDEGIEEVFDFTEPETSWGVVEGVVTHNSEIILRSAQFCNLSEVVIREQDTLEDLKEKVRVATILGTLQSTLTNFRYLRKIWAKNTEEERLLGVSLSGIMDHGVMSAQGDTDITKAWLKDMKQVYLDTNKEWAEKLGVAPSVSIGTVKPAGTTSQLVNSSSGIHARFAPYYIRRVRVDVKDPIYQFMFAKGFPGEQDKMNPQAWVFEFPIKSPEASVMVDDINAVQQLEVGQLYQDHWCEHKVSNTVYYTDQEYMDVGAWVWRNFDGMAGVSFLPKSDHVYVQAPYEAISEDKYKELASKMPKSVDWSELSEFEKEDNTKGTKELACSAGVCEVVDLV